MNKPALNYFLGANSGQGFSSLYSEFTSPERGDFLWILKGGAGCGKSSFMKMLGEAAQRAGHIVEYVKCSGDPDSLDGVYIPTLKTAFMDGTAPHCADAGLAAVDSAYIDLGSFYDVEALTPLGESLKQLNGLCRCHYKQGYSMLSAAASLKEGWLGGLSLSDEKQAVSRRIERHCLREFGAKQKAPGIATKRFLSAYSCHGRTGLPETAELLCSRLIFLQSRCGLDSFALDLVAEKALSAGYDIWLCPDPLLPQQTEAVLIPALSLGYISGSSPLCPQGRCRRLLLDSALSAETEKQLRPRLRRYEELFSALSEEAFSSLAQAKALHDEMERIYNPHVDFGGVYGLVSRYLCRLGLENI